jgi:molybdate/tungstate transport system permease protein
VVIIAYHPMIAPVLIYERFSSYGLNYARPASVLFILVALFFLVGLRLFSMKRKEKYVNTDAQTD